MTFIEGGTCALPTTILAGPVALNGSGQASFSTSALSAASHTVVACYGGDSGFNSSSGNVSQTVNKAATTTTVTCPVSQTYTGAPIEACAALVTGPSLSASLMVSYTNNVNAGLASASATYAETANYLGSTDSETFTISKAVTTTTVTCTASPYLHGYRIRRRARRPRRDRAPE